MVKVMEFEYYKKNRYIRNEHRGNASMRETLRLEIYQYDPLWP